MKTHRTFALFVALAGLLSPIGLQSQALISATNATSGKETDRLNPAPANFMSAADRLSREQNKQKQDPYYDYKLPISFYGRVVDDQTQAVAGASIDFSWTDLSEAGTSQRSSISDQNGLFSLTGVTGGVLTVQVNKAGYRRYASNQSRFEYAYGGPAYYQPDLMNPVIFVLRKDRPGERLIVRSRQEARIESGQTRSFPIGIGDSFVTVERLPDENPNSRFWDAVVSIPNGALQLTTEEFPYEAPEDGYTNTFTITNGLSVKGNQGGMFYIKTPTGYGRAMVYYVPNMPWIYVESWFNPNPASRNLEVDPNNVEIIKP